MGSVGTRKSIRTINMEQSIIAPIPKEILLSELTPDRQLRMTNKSNNEIYVITAHNAPNVMREIGRLREIAFREAGGGTGKDCDIDEFDISDNCYKQLIVWNPEAQEIIGGYRYLSGTDWELDDKGQPILATSHMFQREVPEGLYALHHRAGPFVRSTALPELAHGSQEPLRTRQPVGRFGSADGDQTQRQVFLWKDDHVPQLYP